MNRCNRNMKTENKKEIACNIQVPDIEDFNTIDELSNDVMEDVDIIGEIIDKYDRRTTDHIMALTFRWYKTRKFTKVIDGHRSLTKESEMT